MVGSGGGGGGGGGGSSSNFFDSLLSPQLSATLSGATPERDLQPLPTYIGTTIAQGDAVNQLHSAIVSEQRPPAFPWQNRNE